MQVQVFDMGAVLPVNQPARLRFGLVATGFCVAATPGRLMFASQSQELLAKQIFTLKMLLLLIAALMPGGFTPEIN